MYNGYDGHGQGDIIYSLSSVFVEVKALDCVSVPPAELSLAAQLDSGESLAGVELWEKPRRVQALLTGG